MKGTYFHATIMKMIKDSCDRLLQNRRKNFTIDPKKLLILVMWRYIYEQTCL